VISLAKQLDYLGQSNGLKSVDSVMQSLFYQIEEVRHVVATTSLAYLAEDIFQYQWQLFL
jgi:hypothetical protein